jgi:acyl-coenzyme A thioesterase PaaI-like protein
VELKINYLLPIVEGRVEAEGKVLRAGRNFTVVECDIRDKRGELAAKGLMTFGVAGRAAESAAKSTQAEADAKMKRAQERGTH